MQYYLWLSWCAPPPVAHGISVTILPLHAPLFNCLFTVNCWIYCRMITTRNWNGGDWASRWFRFIIIFHSSRKLADCYYYTAARSITIILAIDKRRRSNDSNFFDIVLRAPARICFVFISPPARSHLSAMSCGYYSWCVCVCDGCGWFVVIYSSRALNLLNACK